MKTWLLFLMISSAATSGTAQHVGLLLSLEYKHPSNPAAGGRWRLYSVTDSFGLVDLSVNLHGTPPLYLQPESWEFPLPYEFVQNPSWPPWPPWSCQTPGCAEMATYGFRPALYPEGDAVRLSLEQTFDLRRYSPQAQQPQPPYLLYGVGSTKYDYYWSQPYWPRPDWFPAALLAAGPFGGEYLPSMDIETATSRVFATLPYDPQFSMESHQFWLGAVGPATVVGLTQTNLTVGAAAISNVGDYNLDGKIDAADYVVWRDTDGSQEGYHLWKSNFGRPLTLPFNVEPPGGIPFPGGASVPEPNALVMAIVCFLLAVFSRPVRRLLRARKVVGLNGVRGDAARLSRFRIRKCMMKTFSFLLLVVCASAQGATVDLLLGTSGNRWGLYAKSSDFGIAALQVRLGGLVPEPAIRSTAPSGFVHGSLPAGFEMSKSFQDGIVTLTFAQVEQLNVPELFRSRLYGVGTLVSGKYGDIGPTIHPITGLTIPWANYSPAPGWERGVLMATGAFGATPPTFVSSAAAVFTALPDPAKNGLPQWYGATAGATMSTISLPVAAIAVPEPQSFLIALAAFLIAFACQPMDRWGRRWSYVLNSAGWQCDGRHRQLVPVAGEHLRSERRSTTGSPSSTATSAAVAGEVRSRLGTPRCAKTAVQVACRFRESCNQRAGHWVLHWLKTVIPNN